MLNSQKLSKKLLEMCFEKNAKLLTAESCTGGLLSANITGIAGSSSVFSHGFIGYSKESKKKFLNVNENTINTWRSKLRNGTNVDWFMYRQSLKLWRGNTRSLGQVGLV